MNRKELDEARDQRVAMAQIKLDIAQAKQDAREAKEEVKSKKEKKPRPDVRGSLVERVAALEEWAEG